MDTDAGAYQFDPSLSQVAAMKPGQALVLTGVDLVKVERLARNLTASARPLRLRGRGDDRLFARGDRRVDVRLGVRAADERRLELRRGADRSSKRSLRGKSR